MIAALLAAWLSAAQPAGAALVGDPSPACVDVGDHTAAVPDFDPIARACDEDALAEPAAFEAAWRSLLARIRAGEGPVPAPDAPGEVQQAIGRGDPRADTLDASSYWGDLAYLQLKPRGWRSGSPAVPAFAGATGWPAAGALEPVAVYLVTTRAWSAPDVNGVYLGGTRVDFQADGLGRLLAVHVWTGVRLPGAPAMAWTNGPVTTFNEPEELDGLWRIRFRQLVRSWTAP